MAAAAAASAAAGDCGAETGDPVVFGFVTSVEGAEHKGHFAVEVEIVGDVEVDLLCRLRDGDVDGDHFAWVADDGFGVGSELYWSGSYRC